MIKYKVDDFVTFSYQYEDTVLGEWLDNQILTITDTVVTFNDIDGEFPLNVIEGLAEDQRDTDT